MRSIAIMLIFLMGNLLFAQQPSDDPVPYSPDEFPQWTQDLGRFEAILIGAIPVTLILGGIMYDIYRLSETSIESGQFRSEYLPQIVNPSRQYTNDEQMTIFYITVSLAAAIALTDFILGAVQRERAIR